MVLALSQGEETLEIFEVVEKFLYLGTKMNSQGRLDRELANRISKANQIYYSIGNRVIGHRDAGQETKLYIILLGNHLSRVMAAEMSYFRRVAGKTRRGHVRNERIREDIKILTLKITLKK